MILNHAAADTTVQRKQCQKFKYHLLEILRKNMILNHAAADTVVQRKLCPNFKFHLLKNLEKYDLKSGSCRHCGPAEAMPKFQISPSQKLRKNILLINAAADTVVQRKLCPKLKFQEK